MEIRSDRDFDAPWRIIQYSNHTPRCRQPSHRMRLTMEHRHSQWPPLLYYTQHMSSLEFGNDRDVFAWARCSWELLHALRSYRIQKQARFSDLILRSEGRSLVPTVRPVLFGPDPYPPPRISAQQLFQAIINEFDRRESKATSCTRYIYEIGQVNSVILDSYVTDGMLVSLRHLPSCIRILRLDNDDWSSEAFRSLLFPSHLRRLDISLIGNGNLDDIELSEVGGLEELHLDGRHGYVNMPLDGLVKKLPSSVKHLQFHWLANFNTPLETLPNGLPQALETLLLSTTFTQPVVKVIWPPALRHLVMWSQHSLQGWNPPPALSTLSLAYWCHPIDELASALNLTSLNLFSEYHLSFHPIQWPPKLRHLDLNLRGWKLGEEAYPRALPQTLREMKVVDPDNIVNAFTKLAPNGCAVRTRP